MTKFAAGFPHQINPMIPVVWVLQWTARLASAQ